MIDVIWSKLAWASEAASTPERECWETFWPRPCCETHDNQKDHVYSVLLLLKVAFLEAPVPKSAYDNPNF